MPEAFFDIVIVGTSIPGLAFGALAAKQGYTVLVLGQDGRPATYSHGDTTLYRQVPLFYGFDSSSAIRSFFRDIGLIAEMRNKPHKVEPHVQFVTPGIRLDLGSRQGQLEEELGREFPAAAGDLRRFLSSIQQDVAELDRLLCDLPMLPPTGFFARRRLKKYLRRDTAFQEAVEPIMFPSELRFASPLAAMVLFLTRLHARPMPALVVRRLIQHLTAGFYEFPQGVDGLKRLFTDRIIANGGAFWPERYVEQIILKGKKVVEVAIQRPRRQAGVRLLVANCQLKPFFSLISAEQQHAGFHTFVKSLQPAYYNYLVNFVVRRDLLPASMARNMVLCLHPRQEASGPNVLWVYTEKTEDRAPEDPTTLVVSCRIPSAELPLEGSGFDELNRKILHSLEWVLPFIREKLIDIHTPYVRLERDTETSRLDPAEVQEVYADAVPNSLELTAVPCETAYKNLLILGDHYLGGLGLEGAIIAARQAFSWTCDNIVLKQILSK